MFTYWATLVLLVCGVLTHLPTQEVVADTFDYTYASINITQDSRHEFANALVAEYNHNNINPLLVIAIAHVESGGTFDNNIKGSSGERSVMQIMPQIRDWCSIGNNPSTEQSIQCASKLITEEITPNLHNKSTEYIISAYNAGFPAVNSCGCIPNVGYVSEVQKWMEFYSRVGFPFYDSVMYSISGVHGNSPYEGIDYRHIDGCGGAIPSPITGIVVFNGFESWVGPYSDGQQNPMLIIEGFNNETVTLFHDTYIVHKGQLVIRGLTTIGASNSKGNIKDKPNCHTHLSIN